MNVNTMETNELLEYFTYQSISSKIQEKNKNSENFYNKQIDEFGNIQTKKKKTKLQLLLESMEELWDESQYKEEFDINKFIYYLYKE